MATNRSKRSRRRATEEPSKAFATLSRNVVDAALAGGKRAAKAGKPKPPIPPVADLRDERALAQALAAAVKLGREQADWIVERRRRQREIAASRRRRGRSRSALAGARLLVAEGDSWFHYPFFDVLRFLEDDFGYDVEHVAHRGDTVESMAYDGGQLDDFERTLERVILRGDVPRAILVSGGGNDIAGDGFAMLLNHRSSPMRGLNAAVLQGVVQTRILVAYTTIVTAVTRLCERLVGAPLPILLHSYAPPVPDGRGYLGGWGWLPGPWLDPGFREKGYDDLAERTEIAEVLIGVFHDALSSLAGSAGFAHVQLVDLRSLLSNELASGRYRADWGNELHPTQSGFSTVAQAFADALDAL